MSSIHASIQEAARAARISASSAEGRLRVVTADCEIKLSTALARERHLSHTLQKLESETQSLRRKLQGVIEPKDSLPVPACRSSKRPQNLEGRITISRINTPDVSSMVSFKTEAAPASSSSLVDPGEAAFYDLEDEVTCILSPSTIMNGLSIVIPDVPDDSLSD